VRWRHTDTHRRFAGSILDDIDKNFTEIPMLRSPHRHVEACRSGTVAAIPGANS
jgi:hypothetical protein